mmetsp:Transcript_4314/g.10455  ORF Transcript_4314/g.10455 Transcript_4314/m.10455 type:complete len:117 (-) Transcript_4314:858-1208(-)
MRLLRATARLGDVMSVVGLAQSVSSPIPCVLAEQIFVVEKWRDVNGSGYASTSSPPGSATKLAAGYCMKHPRKAGLLGLRREANRGPHVEQHQTTRTLLTKSSATPRVLKFLQHGS